MRASPGLCVLLLLAVACVPPPARNGDDPDATPDAGTEIPDAGTLLDTPARTWRYVPLEGARCGNGTDTGMGVNLSPGSHTLVLFLAGGGACWEAAACYVLKTAVHVEDTVQEAVVLKEAADPGLGVLFDRADGANPLREAHHAYLPYCTGDLHFGTNVQTYALLGQTREMHHVGARNLDAALARLGSLPGVTRVVLAGISAGGYGALLNWSRVRAAFGPSVRVDVLDDSGLPIQMPWDRFGTAMQAWKPEWPAGCADCGFEKLVAHYAQEATLPGRAAIFGFRHDQVIATYWGLTTDQVATALDAQRAAAGPNERFFELEGTDHVVLASPTRATSTGTTAEAWLRAFLADDAAPDHAGP